MDSITSNLASRAALATAVAPEDLQPQDAHATAVTAAPPATVETSSDAQSALVALVPEGALHPASPKPNVAMGGSGIIAFVEMEAWAKRQRDLAEQEQHTRVGPEHCQRGAC